ncbi:N-acetylmuramoyl-L-alanine amidase family protein [Clostridium beijerinckii]|uniref:Autolysin n=1 Tax=Clostridium beijerinckii TaxID=1520 RepID=A0A1S8S4A9_CLOBE|nr:hypothetical protein [Clostridium beijerinckii]NRY59524.1 hypothetical protein [Clostridium beijerinckii]OOM60280.1 autolysin [Clostridium beijerinckii]
MRKLNLKKIITMGLITTSILTVATVAAHAEWRQNSTGWWYAEGNNYSRGWKNIGSSRYYFDNNGYMKTGWLNNGKWYHFSQSGAMQTGWIQDGGSWYYLKSDGAMATENTVVDGKLSRFDSNGVWLGYANTNQISNNQQSSSNGNNTQVSSANQTFTESDAEKRLWQVKGNEIFCIHAGSGIEINRDGKKGYAFRLFRDDHSSQSSRTEKLYKGVMEILQDGTYKRYTPGTYTDSLIEIYNSNETLKNNIENFNETIGKRMAEELGQEYTLTSTPVIKDGNKGYYFGNYSLGAILVFEDGTFEKIPSQTIPDYSNWDQTNQAKELIKKLEKQQKEMQEENQNAQYFLRH